MIAPHIGPILEDVQVEMLQSNLQETTGPEMAAQEEITNQASHQTLPPKKQSQTKVVKPARSVQALVTDSKAGKAEVGSRRSNTGKKLRCDIEGTSCLLANTVLILTTSNNLYSERERNILEYTHV